MAHICGENYYELNDFWSNEMNICNDMNKGINKQYLLW